MPNQKISELSVLTKPLSSDTLPIVNDGETKQISVGNLSMIDVTYSELYTLYTGSTLTPGQHYKITDYQTCYDQPNFDANNNAITTGNYKSGSVEELVVLSTSADTLSPNAYSLDYPKDTIKYDISFNLTEVTDGLAKGRIYERIDEVGNRTDYDWRTVVFKRYRQHYAENNEDGKVTINTTATTGSVVGVGTNFQNNFSVGGVIGVFNPNADRIGGFDFYEIVDISGSYYMGITGSYYNTVSDTYYSRASDYSGLSPFQTNTVTVDKNEYEYYTFDTDGDGDPASNGWYNNYLGDNNEGSTFILSNNVFRDGSYGDNYFDSNVVGNTFDDDCHGNKCGRNFQYNSIGDDFDNNTIGDNFRYNFNVANFQENIIGNNFEYNMIGDDDGVDFNFNIINCDSFSHNWTIGYGHFHSNIISDDFDSNVIWGRFGNNLVNGSLNNNFFDGSVDYNQFKQDFNNNKIYDSFQNNVVNYFYQNTALNSFNRNHFNGSTFSNTFSGSFNDNTIGNSFYNNTFAGDASYNQIGINFYSNTIGDSFGVGGGDPRTNKIGSNVYDNTIGEYFNSNTISDNFNTNTIGDYFQQNTILANNVNNINFTEYYKDIVNYTLTNPNIGEVADGTFTNIPTTTNGNGTGATFDVTILNGVATAVINNRGMMYDSGNMVYMDGSYFSSLVGLDISVDVVNPTPAVYTYIDSTILRDFNEDLKLTYVGTSFGIVGITQAID